MRGLYANALVNFYLLNRSIFLAQSASQILHFIRKAHLKIKLLFGRLCIDLGQSIVLLMTVIKLAIYSLWMTK